MKVPWLEVLAVRLSCARSNLASAEVELLRLPAFTHDLEGRPYGDAAAVSRLEASARAHIIASRRAVRRGALGAACREAARAKVLARAAARHPSLLVLETIPADTWLTTWPPLFFPVATAVGSALFDASRRLLRRARLRRRHGRR